MADQARFAIGQNGIVDVNAWQALYSPKAQYRAKKRLAQVLDEFEAFVNDYLQYFNTDAEIAQVPTPWLNSKICEALDAYWAPLARVAEQYLVPHYQQFFFDETVELKLNGYLEGLKNLMPPGKLDTDILRPLLYFDKISLVHRYPYTNTVFVGMPYHLVMMDKTLGLQAVPHELGHYLYWNMGELAGDGATIPDFQDKKQNFKEGALAALRAAMPQRKMVASSPQQPLIDLLSDWYEEIFADVIGARLGGEKYFASTQELLRQSVSNVKDLVSHDQSHPSPCLRPFIVAYTLHLYGSDLIESWDDFKVQFGLESLDGLEIGLTERIEYDNLEDIGVLEKVLDFIKGPHKNPQISVRAICEALQIIIDYINEQITLYQRIEPTATFHIRALSVSPEFKDLLELVKIRKGQADTVYRMLLRPQSLEGLYKYKHQHDAWSSGNETVFSGVNEDRHGIVTYHSAKTLGPHTH